MRSNVHNGESVITGESDSSLRLLLSAYGIPSRLECVQSISKYVRVDWVLRHMFVRRLCILDG